eukprot:CAMPEP_0181282086 /NCGR_PEP_ID=MMETSP1097-20121128/13976_1 /TAXON_ID=35684 /ORGANISM="Pseudopedinella elastica, Strain CCMP716" /LENGTH=46 /DNA_ID= /DNA_START= /DNA_END= /DNA_ORIENTATION=
MLSMSVTLDISQAPRSWLNALASMNEANMDVTPETSQLEMSSLKEA